MSLLGLDVGTSGCKAVIAGADGRILSSATRSYKPSVPGFGRLELDPEAVWRAVCAAAREVVEATAPDPPVALAIAALGEACIVLDSHGRPASPIIVSSDQRAIAQHRELLERFGASRILAITGLEPRPHYTASKIRWWLDQGAMPSGGRVALVQDFIASRLGVAAVIDPSLATRTMLLDRNTRRWSPDLLDALGIGVDHLPRIVDAGTEIGLIDNRGKESLGLRDSCAYVVGGLDAACLAMAVGAIEPGRCVLSMGTVASISAVLAADADGGMIPTGPHVVPERRLAIGAAQAAGAALRWYRDLLVIMGPDGDARTDLTFERLLDEVEDRPSSVIFVPHLTGSRFAFGDASLTGTLTGLTLATDRTELTRAILEGVALELAVVCERFEAADIEISALTAAGGGSRSHTWVQIIADVIGRPIASTGSGDAGALGAALLAGVGSRSFASFDAAAAAGLSAHEPVEPRQADAAWWSRRQADYKSIVAALSEVPSLRQVRGPVPD